MNENINKIMDCLNCNPILTFDQTKAAMIPADIALKENIKDNLKDDSPDEIARRNYWQ